MSGRKEEITFTARRETLEEIMELIPEATSRQEAIRFCIADTLERRRRHRVGEGEE